MKQENILSMGNETDSFQIPNIHRRKFLSKLSVGAVIAAGLASCSKTTSDIASSANVQNAVTSDSDVDILNYAYLLEQLEAAFYIKVTDDFYAGAPWYEKRKLEQIRDHEIAHREFFKTALGSSAIDKQEFDFSSIDFTSRVNVLTAARTFEDTGVSAYNGVAYKLKSADYLLVAGKIVSVEARHAAYLRDLLEPVSFASIVDSNALDLAATQNEVMKAIAPYLK